MFYIAKPVVKDIIMQKSEIKDIRWCTFEETIEILTFDDWKTFFKDVLSKIGVEI